MVRRALATQGMRMRLHTEVVQWQTLLESGTIK